jgi:alpha-1,2-glucosyltransferase
VGLATAYPIAPAKSSSFKWNNKITTPPGLYLTSTTVVRGLVALVGHTSSHKACTVYVLRLTNVLVFCMTFVLLHKIIDHIHRKTDDVLKVSLTRLMSPRLTRYFQVLFKISYAASLSLFPLNYFFQFLYYTDNGSTFFCLLAYYLSLRNKPYGSAIAAFIAIFYRQTNIIWVLFYLALQVLHNAKTLVDKHRKDGSREKTSWILRYLVEAKPIDLIEAIRKDLKQKTTAAQNLVELVQLGSVGPYLALIALFGLFVHLNNGIVVGDRSNHEASSNCRSSLSSVRLRACLSFSSSPMSIRSFSPTIATTRSTSGPSSTDAISSSNTPWFQSTCSQLSPSTAISPRPAKPVAGSSPSLCASACVSYRSDSSSSDTL